MLNQHKRQIFSSNPAFRFFNKQWYFDEIYQRIVVDGTTKLAGAAFFFDKTVVDGLVNTIAKVGVVLSHISDWLDRYVVDGLINAVASLAKTIGNFARNFQTGRLQHYLLTMVLVVLCFFIIKIFFPAI